jgi:hypothetical protein
MLAVARGHPAFGATFAICCGTPPFALALLLEAP